jgi:hypothetical protein
MSWGSPLETSVSGWGSSLHWIILLFHRFILLWLLENECGLPSLNAKGMPNR